MSFGDATQKIIGDTVQTVAEQANEIVQASSSQAAYDKALTLGEQIANYTCKELKEQIPPMITSTTNEIIKQLTAKIDSEEFTTDFINVLQKKLLDANSPYSEPFLKKFDDLFDRIINDAEKRRDKKEYAKEKEEQQGYNSMSQDTETIDRLNAEIADLKKSLSMYEPDIEVEEPVGQGRANADKLTTTGREMESPYDTKGMGRRKHSKKKRNQKKPTKQTKRVRFSMKK